MRTTRTLFGAVLASAAVWLAGYDAFAQTASNTVKVELGGGAPVARRLALPKGKSAIIDLPVDARDVLVTDPKVADAVLRTPRRIYVLGVGGGQTDAVFFDAAGRQILSLDIRVDQPTSALEDTIKRIAPGADVKVEAVNDGLVLTGSVANEAESDRIQKIAERFLGKADQQGGGAGASTGGGPSPLVINAMTVRSPEQVMIKVRVVEMQRNLIKQLGFNTQALLGQAGLSQFSFANAAQYAINNGFLGGSSSGYNLDTTTQPEMIVPCAPGVSGNCYAVAHGTNFTSGGVTYDNGNTATVQNTAGSTGLNKANATVQAFERAGLLRSLAEPNLTAVSGESAKFLAGGEFPVPVGTDQNGNVIVAFKSYGVGLGFTPVVLSEGRISLKISTEVSELSDQGELKFNSSLTIPGLTVRRAETTVEMPSGGALMIAGLIKEETQEDIDSIPGLASVPVLGSLFRSRDYLSGETELVVIVETYLAKPGAPNQYQTPVDGLIVASDMDTDLMGRLNKAYKGDRAPPPPAWQGPGGYVIE